MFSTLTYFKKIMDSYSEKRYYMNTFHTIGLFLSPLKTSENQRFSDVIKGNRKSHLHEMCSYSIFFLNKYFVKFGLWQRCPSLAVVKQNKNNEKGEKYLMQLFKVYFISNNSIFNFRCICHNEMKASDFLREIYIH